jgi:inhibitor of KinA
VTPTIAAAGDQAFVVRFAAVIDPATGDRIGASLRRLDGDHPTGVLDIVPGYAAILVIYDAGRSDPAEVHAWLTRSVEEAAAEGGEQRGPPARRVEIPVLYDPKVGPDLEPLAAEKNMAVEALVAMHAASLYRCYFLGFRPGFPFLGGLDPRLHAPRLSTPRLRVSAGSIGIGGQQAGIYPVDSPGGWRIIGRTPLRLFDPEGPEPFLVRPGDEVVFAPITIEGFKGRGGIV